SGHRRPRGDAPLGRRIRVHARRPRPRPRRRSVRPLLARRRRDGSQELDRSVPPEARAMRRALTLTLVVLACSPACDSPSSSGRPDELKTELTPTEHLDEQDAQTTARKSVFLERPESLRVVNVVLRIDKSVDDAVESRARALAENTAERDARANDEAEFKCA